MPLLFSSMPPGDGDVFYEDGSKPFIPDCRIRRSIWYIVWRVYLVSVPPPVSTAGGFSTAKDDGLFVVMINKSLTMPDILKENDIIVFLIFWH